MTVVVDTLLEPSLAHDAKGLPLWFAPLDGPVTGALVFRVGVGDETLVRRGFTHMVEHLTLSRIDDRQIQWNGFVDLNRTVFHATGPQDRVEQFLHDVCRSLGDLPLDRLEAERRVLAAEARRRGPSITGELFSRRWGARAWGSSAWWEMAIGGARADELEHWRRTFFSLENASAWMTALPSPSFTLPLPSGCRVATPQPDDIASGRLWFRHQTNQVAFMARCARGHASAIAAQILVETLQRELRSRGLCYAVDAAWHRLDLRQGALVVACDTVPQREAELARTMIAIADELAHDVPRDLIHEVRARRQSGSADDEARTLLDQWSLDLLLGAPRTTAAAERAAEDAVARFDVWQQLNQLAKDLLVMVPPNVGVTAPDFTPYPRLVSPRIEGRPHGYAVLFQPQHARGGLVVGEAGLSIEAADSHTSVLWNDVDAVMRWHDGTRMVIDARGQGILVEPTRFVDGAAAIADIDARTRPDRVVQVGPRYGLPTRPSAPAHVLKLLRRVRASLTVLLAAMVPAGVAVALLAPSPAALAGWLMVGLGLIGTPWFATVSTPCPRPMVWDDGNTRKDAPANVDQSAWFVPGGLLLGWAAARGHLTPRWAEVIHDDLAAFEAKQITGPELYRRLGGTLTDDLFDDETNEFFADYLFQRPRGYHRDLTRASRTRAFFDIPDTWISQTAVIMTVEASFRRWRRLGRWSLLRHLRRATWIRRSRWRGSQADEWGYQLVQRRRRRRWKP